MLYVTFRTCLAVLVGLALTATGLWAAGAEEEPAAVAEKRYVTDPTTGKVVVAPEYGGTLTFFLGAEPDNADTRASCKTLERKSEVADVRLERTDWWRFGVGYTVRTSAAVQIVQNPEPKRRPWRLRGQICPVSPCRESADPAIGSWNEVGFSSAGVSTGPPSAPGCRTSGGTSPWRDRGRVSDGRRIRPSDGR